MHETPQKSDEFSGGALSVTELTRRVKRLLEDAFPEVWVRGEISGLRIQSSGHAYFSLKDAGAQISAVMFRADLLRFPGTLREGAQVAAFGRVSVYEPRGAYQLVVRVALDDGLGRLRLEFEALKTRLDEEGLFDSKKKRPLPYPPRVVGFVTSPTGAAVADFISVLRRRNWRGRLIVFPTKVQGAGASEEIAAQIRRAGKMPELDTLVVGRGGGSAEDLWAFNEEAVVRAIAACPSPVISAVGHEIDFTLADFAADRRAETPTAAAELITSLRLDAERRLDDAGVGLERGADSIWENATQAVEIAEARLSANGPGLRVRHAAANFSIIENRMQMAFARKIAASGASLNAAGQRLAEKSPAPRLALVGARVASLARSLEREPQCRLAERLSSLAHRDSRLRATGIEPTLKRGFALVYGDTGAIIDSGRKVRSGAPLTLRFADGEARAEGR